MASDSSPTVSAVLTVYNKERYLERAIRSVLSQTFLDYELLIIDDGSKDGSRAVAERFVGGKARLIAQPNGGPSAARNRGVREATGRYIAFLDGDDEWMPERLTRSVAFAQAHPEAGAVFCNVRDTSDVSLAMSPDILPGGSREGLLPSFWESKKNGYFIPSGFLCEREKMLAVGLPDDRLRFYDDTEIFVRLALRYPVGFLADPLAYYHRESEQRHCAGSAPREYPNLVRLLRAAVQDPASRLSESDRVAIRDYIVKILLFHATSLLEAGRKTHVIWLLLTECWGSRYYRGRVKALLREALIPTWAKRVRRALRKAPPKNQ